VISREWLTTWLAARLTRARVETERPVIPMAEEMTDELIEKWLEGEATYWLAAAEKRGIPLQRKSLLIQVSRFYDARLLALRRQREGS
jgi:hypothetical protein